VGVVEDKAALGLEARQRGVEEGCDPQLEE
jgi:hypothetical protein